MKGRCPWKMKKLFPLLRLATVISYSSGYLLKARILLPDEYLYFDGDRARRGNQIGKPRTNVGSMGFPR